MRAEVLLADARRAGEVVRTLEATALLDLVYAIARAADGDVARASALLRLVRRSAEPRS